MNKRLLLTIIISIMILSGCRVVSDATPTAEIALILPSDTPEPTTTEEIILPTETPTQIPPTPTAQPTQVIVSVPEAIDIQYPFPGAVITSPLTVTGLADATFEQNLIVQLTGESSEIAQVPTTIQADTGSRGGFSAKVEYAVPDDNPVMLQVFWRSPKDGSLMHLNGFMLQPGAQSAPQKPVEEKVEKLFLSEVRIGLNNGKLELQADGSAEGLFENNLQYALCGNGSGHGGDDFVCGSGDNIMLTGSTIVNAPDMGKRGDFSIRHMLPNGQWQSAILVIYSTSAANGLVDHATSMIVKNGP